jgi:hypothetical protein
MRPGFSRSKLGGGAVSTLAVRVPRRYANGNNRPRTQTPIEGNDQMWLLRLALIVVGRACIAIGPIAVYKGFQVMRSGNLRQVKGALRYWHAGSRRLTPEAQSASLRRRVVVVSSPNRQRQCLDRQRRHCRHQPTWRNLRHAFTGQPQRHHRRLPGNAGRARRRLGADGHTRTLHAHPSRRWHALSSRLRPAASPSENRRRLLLIPRP